MKTNTAIVICAAIIVGAFILGGARIRYKGAEYHCGNRTWREEFMSDLIVWRGWIVVDNPSITDSYAQLEVNKRKVQDFIMQKGIATG